MDSTVYEASKDGPAVCLMGAGRLYAIGDTAYRFKRPDPFPNGMVQTLPMFARGVPVTYVDGKWQESQLARPIIVQWSRAVTILV